VYTWYYSTSENFGWSSKLEEKPASITLSNYRDCINTDVSTENSIQYTYIAGDDGSYEI